VVKPVAPILRHLTLFSGNTILGDGSVIMILDPNGIAAATGEMTAMGETQIAENATQSQARGDERITLLVFKAGDGGPKAVPLSLVARLEEIELAKVEYSNNRPMVQYRDKLMPLVPIDARATLGRDGRCPVLVFTDQDRSMGLVVDEIVDIVEDRLKVELQTDQPGFLGSAIIAGRATDLIDAGYYLQQAFGDWFTAAANRQVTQRDRPRRVLLIDDSSFFRNLLTPMLTVAGYEVAAAESGEDAIQLLDVAEPFDVIVSDIEMPGLSGFDVATAIRGHAKYRDVPLIALSSYTGPEDFERARSAGFTDYVAKNDRESLLTTLASAASLAPQGAA
jgi:two-component system chemotaxis sensor kinase CheA